MKLRERHVVIVGAGLAGLSCAIACVDGGADVTVLEARPRLGGATWSFDRNGLSFDNGQHVFLRCCTAYRRFLDRIGSSSDAPLQDRLNLPVLEPSADGEPARVGWIRATKLPAPAHLLPALLSYPFLTLSERMRLSRAVRALQKLRLSDESLDDLTFECFLKQHGQDEHSISRLWDLITLPTVNLRAKDASLLLAAKVFKTGLLEESDAADIGWSHVPLSRLHGDAALRVLTEGGASVRTRCKVTSCDVVSAAETKATGVTVDGEHLGADAVVLAVPHEQASELLPDASVIDRQALSQLGRSPIIDVHLVYDRKVMPFDIAAGVGTPVQYVFDRSDAAGLEGDGQCLAISISNADDDHGDRPEKLIDYYRGAVESLFPAARSANLVDAVVSREHAATFRGVPGTQRLRTRANSGVANLFVAGAWTDTGWPATMEGAVRSGVTAASSVLDAIGSSRAVKTSYEEVVA